MFLHFDLFFGMYVCGLLHQFHETSEDLVGVLQEGRALGGGEARNEPAHEIALIRMGLLWLNQAEIVQGDRGHPDDVTKQGAPPVAGVADPISVDGVRHSLLKDLIIRVVNRNAEKHCV
jgi:hypothetical protein